MSRALTTKEKKFIREYLVDLNATQAAIRAGYSKTSASAIGHTNIRKVEIQSAIFDELDKRARRTTLTQDRIVLELKRIAFSDITNIMSWNDSAVNLKPSDELKKNKTAAISEVSEHVNQHARTVKVKMHDKIRALELLAKHLGMFVDRVDPTKGLHGAVDTLGGVQPAMTKEDAIRRLKEAMDKPS